MTRFYKQTAILFTFLIFSRVCLSQINADPKIYGVTIDDLHNLNQIIISLKNLSVKPTVRIVFDEGEPASKYIKPLRKIHDAAYIMGQLADSYDMSKYTVQDYNVRTIDYVNKLSNEVDIWEIGNEANGEWLGDPDSVISKINNAFNYVRAKEKKSALTLYCNSNCFENPDNEMFTWANNKLPQEIREGIDYLFVSYYEDDCNGYQPDWRSVFDSLHRLFPYSKLGIGECGTNIDSLKEEYMRRYYDMNITTIGFVGGYFWWYFKQDCVPYTKPLWKVLNEAIR